MERLRTFVGITVFWIGLSVVGDAFVSIVVAQRLAGLAPAASIATWLGLVTFAGIVAGMLVQPIAGRVSDALRSRWGRRWQVLAGAAAVVAALALFESASDLAGLALAFVLIQVASGSAQAAQQGFIPDLVERSWRGRAAGAKGFADLGGAFLGFVVLAAALQSGRDGSAVAAVAALVAVTAIATVLLVREPRPDAAQHESVAVARLSDRGGFARVVFARFLFLLGTFAVGRYLLLFVAERFEVSPVEAGSMSAALFAVLTLVTAIAALPSGWLADRIPRGRVMLMGGLLSALGAGGILAAPSLQAMLLFGALMAVGAAAFSSANWALATDLVAPAAAGTGLAIANFGTAGAAAAAGLLGPVLDYTRPFLPELGFGTILLPAIALFMISAAVAAPLGRSDDPPPRARTMSMPDRRLPLPEVKEP